MKQNNKQRVKKIRCFNCDKLLYKKNELSIHLVLNPKCLEFAALEEIRYPTIKCPLCRNIKKKNYDDIKIFKSHLKDFHSKELGYTEFFNNKITGKVVKEVKAKDGIDKVSLNSKLVKAKHSARRYAEIANELADKESKKILLESEVEDFKKIMQREPKDGSVIK